ncbi:MAG: SET domain-containing protein [Verrucomicrobiota bacterium]
MNTYIYVDDCDLGRGLFAAKDIPSDTAVHTFTGPILTSEEVEALGEASCYPIQIAPDAYIDPLPPGRFINHSCSPNAAIRDRDVLFTLRDIKKGEELRFDYSTTMSEQRWRMDCYCGADSCRRVISDFHDLPHDLKHHYIGLGIVQDFILIEFSTFTNENMA